MFETLTGAGLATSGGLNAYIPLLTIGLLGRYTDALTLPASWQWLENGWTIAILAVLLAIEMVADKVPVIDHINDVIQTVVRPTSGGIAFGAATSAQSTTVTDPGEFFSSHQWIPVVAGIVIALVVHTVKAAARPVINISTAGVGGPVVSVIEDAFSVLAALVAILLPALIVVVLLGFGWLTWVVVRRRRRRRRDRLAATRTPPAPADPWHGSEPTRTLDLWR